MTGNSIVQYAMKHNRRKTIDSNSFTGNPLPVNEIEGQASEAERGRHKPTSLFLVKEAF